MKPIRSVIVLFFLAVANLVSTASATYSFRTLNVADGLSDNKVYAIYKDNDGFLWFRTEAFMNRYDGVNFRHYHQPASLQADLVSSASILYETNREGLIFSTNNENLSIFDPEKESYLPDVQAFFKGLGMTENVRMVFIDKDKNYWLRTESESLFLYDLKKQQLVRILNGSSRYWMQEGFVQAILKVGQSVWIMTDSGVLKRMDFRTRKIVSQDNYLLGKKLNAFSKKMNSIRLSLCPDEAGNFYVLHDRGVFYYQPAQRKWTDLFPHYANKVNVFTSIAMDHEGNLWVGTGQEGLFVIAKGNSAITRYPMLQIGFATFIMNDISSIFIDENDGIWIGTLNAGICYYHKNLNKFHQVRYPFASASPNGPFKNVKCMAEDKEGNIHVGTVDGVYVYNPKTGSSRSLDQLKLDRSGPNNVWIQALCDRSGRVWMASFYFGLVCNDHGRITIYKNNPANPNSMPENQIRSILLDSKGRFWVAPLNYGVGLFDPSTGRFDRLIDRYPEMQNHKHVASMCQLPGGDVLFLSTKGLFKFDAKKSRLIFTDPELTRISSQLAQINNAFYDSRGILWFCTQDGLCLYDRRTRKVTLYHREDGLPNNCVQSMEEDRNGILWLGTSKGLSRLDVQKGEDGYSCSFTNFSEYDGLQGLPFSFHAHLMAQDGTMYFGGSNGFNYFKPTEVLSSRSSLTPVITGLSLFNKPLVLDKEYNGRVILKKAINKVQRIKLRHNENFFSIDFSALNFLDPEHTVYRYMLEGLDPDWTELRSRAGRASYTDLSPGTYTFRVMASSNGKNWKGTEATLNLVIKPPFWASTLAFFIYLLLSGYLLLQLLNWMRRRNRKRVEAENERERIRQREELDQMKFRFFTNISHEFRTPLTLILTPLENMVNHLGDSVPLDASSLKHQLSSIHRNAQNLLSLVNQLLDFRKLEMVGVELKLTQGDMVEFTEVLASEFATLAKLKNIYLFFETPEKSVYMGFDKDKMQKILNNILSNAVKFTPSSGTIQIELKKEFLESRGCDMLMISVEDNGDGISEEDLAHIFERFYQSQRENENYLGSGIGLHLVKEYVNLHNGEIFARSVLGKGTVFTMYFPLNLSQEEESQEPLPVQTVSDSLAESDHPSERRSILIVEDNQEFRQFLKEQLTRQYTIYEAPDGVAGCDFAMEHQPDLIVSDIMMPKRDGLELCRMLKSDLRTSHIPIILLTARSAEDVKLSGYEVGADYFITKPFNLDILLVRMAALIENQSKRQELFRKTLEVVASEITVTSLDEKLMQKTIGLVEKNIENPEYSVDDLASDVGMSRGHLYRKLLAITGKSPVEFIRTIRLKRAAQLLKESQLTVNEVAYMVGFNNPKYFRKYFKEEFGVSPSHYESGDNHSDTVG
jgi:signal transduction histidine kinase/ligand-binding sensor domain-containing protein/DNA-binding response OmpR family regulator